MPGIASHLLAIFDGDKGIVFTVLLVALLVGGVVLLIVNLSLRPRAPPAPAWEAVPDDTPVPVRKAPRRRA